MRILALGLVLSALILFGVFSTQFLEAEHPESPTTQQPVPPVMYQFLGHITSLQPLMVNQQSFSSSENEEKIRNHLTALNQLATRLDQYHQLDTTSFHISMAYLQDHLRDAESSFRAGNKNFSRRMLFATLGACGSCHAQVEEKEQQWRFDAKQLGGTTFEKAEFLYAIRQYDDALGKFKGIVKGFKRDGDRFQLDRSMERVMSVLLRNKRDLAEATKALGEFRKNKQLPEAVQKTFPKWEAQVQALRTAQQVDIKKLNAEQLEALVQRILPVETARQLSSDEHLVLALYLSGLIYQFVNSHPVTGITPKLLYWLAIFESVLQEDYIYSLGEFYLQECITRFPATETASLCYLHLEQKLVAGFTGSAGVQIPSDITQKLNSLRSLIRERQSR